MVISISVSITQDVESPARSLKSLLARQDFSDFFSRTKPTHPPAMISFIMLAKGKGKGKKGVAPSNSRPREK